MVSMKTVLTLCSLPSAATKHYIIIKFVLHPPSEVCEHSSCVSTLYVVQPNQYNHYCIPAVLYAVQPV